MIEFGRRDELVQYLCERIQLIPTPNVQAIGNVDEDGRIKGVVGYDCYTGTSMELHWAGEPGFLSREFLRVTFGYPLVQLKCKVIILKVPAANTRSLDQVKRLGFIPICEIPDAVDTGALVILTMRPDQCRWLEYRHGKKQPEAAACA